MLSWFTWCRMTMVLEKLGKWICCKFLNILQIDCWLQSRPNKVFAAHVKSDTDTLIHCPWTDFLVVWSVIVYVCVCVFVVRSVQCMAGLVWQSGVRGSKPFTVCVPPTNVANTHLCTQYIITKNGGEGSDDVDEESHMQMIDRWEKETLWYPNRGLFNEETNSKSVQIVCFL